MNLVKLVADQLSSETMAKLGTMLGIDEEKVESAVGAAIPSLLSGLVGLSSQDDGIRKLTSALGSLGGDTFSNFGRALSGDANALQQKGSSLLGSLFGDSMSSGLASAISRFTGVSPGIVKTLLSYLAPLVLGQVASQWKNLGGTASDLTNMLTGQKRSIESALPAGFSLNDVPGMSLVNEAVRAPARAAYSETAPKRSMMSTLLPLALVIAGAFLLWNYMRNRPAPAQPGAGQAAIEGEEITVMRPTMPEGVDLPDVTGFKDELTGVFQSIGDAMTSIKDAATAEAALPKLEELNRKLDTMKTTLQGLPEAGRSALQTFLSEQLEPLQQQATKTLSLPGLSDQIKALINDLVRKLQEIGVLEKTS